MNALYARHALLGISLIFGGMGALGMAILARQEISMAISFPVWGFYLIGLIGVILSVALIGWLVMLIERWWTKRQESKYLSDK
jgi:hypothetical protein